MLDQCRKRGLYRDLIALDLSQPLPIAQDQYKVIMAIGVISKGGLFGLSLNDHALADPDYPAGIARLKEAGHKLLIEDYGTHLPGIDLKSMIYLFERK